MSLCRWLVLAFFAILLLASVTSTRGMELEVDEDYEDAINELELETELDMDADLDLDAVLETVPALTPAGAATQLPGAQAPVAVQVAPVTKDPAGLTPAGSTPAGGEDNSEVGLCEVCMYVMENKMQHQPYLCKGLKDPHYQNVCVQVMESLMWWISNEVYWVNYGCQMNQNGAISWVRPCPAHAICSWLQHLYLRKPYCAPDKNFPKPA